MGIRPFTSVKFKVNSSTRLSAAEGLTPHQIQLGTVLYHLKQHKIKADFTDNERDQILARSNLASVLMGLSSFGWSHSTPEPVVGGLYCCGEVVRVSGSIPLSVMQTSLERVLITVDADANIRE